MFAETQLFFFRPNARFAPFSPVFCVKANPVPLTGLWLSINEQFVIYKVVKYREILTQYNLYLISSHWYLHMWRYQILYLHMWRYNLLDYLWLFHWLTAVHFRTSNAYNFLICEQKHQVWVFIFLVRTWGIFWYQNYLGLLKFLVFHLFNLLHYACIACRQDLMRLFVYNKKKIQFFC